MYVYSSCSDELYLKHGPKIWLKLMILNYNFDVNNAVHMNDYKSNKNKIYYHKSDQSKMMANKFN